MQTNQNSKISYDLTNFPTNLFFKIPYCRNTLFFTKPISRISNLQLNQPAKLVVLVKVVMGISVSINFFVKKELLGIHKILYNQWKQNFVLCIQILYFHFFILNSFWVSGCIQYSSKECILLETCTSIFFCQTLIFFRFFE